LIATVSAKYSADNLASTANIRENTAGKLIDTTGAWAAGEIVTLTDAATIAVDMSTFVNGVVTVAGNRTLGAPTNSKVGQAGVIKVVASGADRTLAKASVYKSGATFPVVIPSGTTVYLYYFVVSSAEIILTLVDGVA
jgi:hypothetical protein